MTVIYSRRFTIANFKAVFMAVVPPESDFSRQVLKLFNSKGFKISLYSH